jgi:predicted RNase H-like nuclease (RuvC/YqgF family)
MVVHRSEDTTVPEDQDQAGHAKTDMESLRRELANNANLIKEIVHLHRRLTDNFQSMVTIDTKVSDALESIVELQNHLGQQKSMLDVLMASHNNQKAVRSALGWLIEKAPTLAAIMAFTIWLFNEWQNRKGGGS